VRLVRILQVVLVQLGALALVFAAAAMGAGSVAAEEPVGGEQNAPAAATASTVVTLTATITPTFDLPDYAEEDSCFPLEVVADPALKVVDVEVEVAIAHTWVGDLILRLVSPDGPYVTMLHRPGLPAIPDIGDNSNLLPSAPLTFADRFADDAETMGDPLADAAVICQDDGRCSYFPNPDEDAGSLPAFAGLAGTAAAGSWQFCASDNSPGDVGVLHQVTLRVAAAEAPPGGDVFLPMVRR
jgi:subtilisin-like proprotein convertase family protein